MAFGFPHSVSICTIDPLEHTLTLGMLNAIDNVTCPTIVKVGDWSLPLSPIPTEDRARPIASLGGWLQLGEGLVIPDGAKLQCGNYFPPGGGMDWHTDSGQPGWRLYVFNNTTTADSGKHSHFRYRGLDISEGDIGAYVFETGVGCWHAIESRCHRMSCGLQIPKSLADDLCNRTILEIGVK